MASLRQISILGETISQNATLHLYSDANSNDSKLTKPTGYIAYLEPSALIFAPNVLFGRSLLGAY